MRIGTIVIVIGTRPEGIKLAPVAQSLIRRGLAVELISTGQHPRLDPAALGLPQLPHRRFHCRGGGDPVEHADAVAATLAPVMGRSVSLVIVQGDTSSALGGAKAAARAGIAVAHVEAGLRSFDRAMPWPEEDNRIAIDALAALLLAPTPTSADNLRREGLAGAIHVTGNSGIDALRARLGKLPPAPLRRSSGLPRILVTCHRRENWGAAFAPVALALTELIRSPWLRIDVVLHPNPAASEVMRDLLSGHPRMQLLAPMDHVAMLDAMRAATLILSDSGGIQEEAPALGVPLLVLREKTERPEGVASGNIRLVGTDYDTIVTAVRSLLADEEAYAAMAQPALPYGDGYASERIADIVAAYLAEQQEERRIPMARSIGALLSA